METDARLEPAAPPAPEPAGGPKPSVPPAPLGAAVGSLLAWLAVGVVRLVATNVAAVSEKVGASLRVTRAAYDLGHVAVLGLLSAGVVLAFGRLRRGLSPRRAAVADVAAIAALACAAAFPLVGPDLNDFSTGLVEDRKLSVTLVRSVLVLGVGAVIPVVAALGRWLARPRLRIVAGVLALAAAVWNHFVLTNDYPGAHLYLNWVAAIFGACALATVSAPRLAGWSAGRWAAIAAPLLAIGTWSLVARPREVVGLALLSETGNTLAPFLLRLRAAVTIPPPANVPPALLPWFADRSHAPSVPPTQPSGRKTKIVILYTMDSVRAEVVNSGKHDAILPEMVRMRREGVSFVEARAPGTGTSFTLSAVFMGKYYSEQYWTMMPNEDSVYPWDDQSIRFTDILSTHRIPTVAFGGRKFMLNEYGISRGFDENTFVKPLKKNTKANTGRQLGEASAKRLEKHDGGPLFLWIHNMDPHAPYDLAGLQGSHYDRYVREVGLADQEIGRLRALIEKKGWADRTTYIISADHGEGFREHGTTSHSVSMYDELMRVPLIIKGPDVVPRQVDTLVSLVDLGPTILDLFELPTPGSFMGQSLLPILQGRPANLTRPVAAETRLKQALILPNGVKLIRDQRLGTREMYDLKADPGEHHNLVEEPGADGEAQMNLLAAFFTIHTLKRPGYTPPYRTW